MHVAKSFFESPEFQSRGYWAYLYYDISLGRRPTYAEFIPDMSLVGGNQSPQSEVLSKAAFMEEWTQRTAFRSIYDKLSNAGYVDTLISKAQIAKTNRDLWVDQLNDGRISRAQVLRQIVETAQSQGVGSPFYYRGYVSMMYFGFLRRDPDQLGFEGHRNKLMATGDPRPSVFDFIYSREYLIRFGKP